MLLWYAYKIIVFRLHLFHLCPLSKCLRLFSDITERQSKKERRWSQWRGSPQRYILPTSWVFTLSFLIQLSLSVSVCFAFIFSGDLIRNNNFSSFRRRRKRGMYSQYMYMDSVIQNQCLFTNHQGSQLGQFDSICTYICCPENQASIQCNGGWCRNKD